MRALPVAGGIEQVAEQGGEQGLQGELDIGRVVEGVADHQRRGAAGLQLRAGVVVFA